MKFVKTSVVTFVARGINQRFELTCDAPQEIIESSIIEKFGTYRKESLCINGENMMYPNIKSGYAIIEGKMADMLSDEGKPTYYPLKNMNRIMMLGLQKGDILHLKGVSSFTINEVDYGNTMLCVELV